jgi:hypothetical protein
VRFARRNVVPFRLDIATTERLLVNAGAGDDTISVRKVPAGLIAGTFNGQGGDDTITGTGSAFGAATPSKARIAAEARPHTQIPTRRTG